LKIQLAVVVVVVIEWCSRSLATTRRRSVCSASLSGQSVRASYYAAAAAAAAAAADEAAGNDVLTELLASDARLSCNFRNVYCTKSCKRLVNMAADNKKSKMVTVAMTTLSWVRPVAACDVSSAAFNQVL